MHLPDLRKGAMWLLPTAAVVVWIELWHVYGFPIPVPFLLLLTSVVIAGAFGGLGPGLIGAAAASLLIFHAYFVGFGPEPLTGTAIQALLGSALLVGVGFLLGRLRDQRDGHLRDLLAAQRREQEAPLLLASELVKLGYYVWDAVSDQPIVVSEQHARNYGISVEEFIAGVSRIGEGYALVHPDDREQVEQWCIQLRAGQQVDMEYRIPTSDGIKWMRAIVRPVLNDAGVVVREICASLDVTEQKLTENRLVESQKLDSIGKLTAGIAHDFNNILAVVLGNIELTMPLVDDGEAREMLDAASYAAQRGASLTKQLLAFGRKSMLDPKVTDANDVIRKMHDLFRRTLPATIRVETVLAGGLWPIEVDRPQLESALLNLAINARDAMPDGGHLTLETANIRIDDEYCAERGIDVDPGRYVMIAVSDDGTGMPPETRARVWEPFFTTKPVGKGSGLGLAMVYGFANQSLGHVQIYSEPGAGTSVRMYFPESSGKIDKMAGRPVLASAQDPTQRRVLLVEDQADVRKIVHRQLERLGFSVVQAVDGVEALAMLRSNAGFDLVLTDVVMPGEIQGPRLAEIVAADFPGIKVILMSGYPKGAIENGNGGTKPIPKLTKPVQLAELAAVINRTLNGG